MLTEAVGCLDGKGEEGFRRLDFLGSRIVFGLR